MQYTIENTLHTDLITLCIVLFTDGWRMGLHCLTRLVTYLHTGLSQNAFKSERVLFNTFVETTVFRLNIVHFNMKGKKG